MRVERYLSNSSELEAKDKQLEELRVCILNIPKSFTNQDFENLFISIFGPIKNAYIKEVGHRDTNLGFVTFTQQSQSQKALNMKVLQVSDCAILFIKKFTAKKNHNIGYNTL